MTVFPTGRPPRAGVVTVSYGSGDVLGRFLDSVSGASAAHTALVVADNRSEPAIREIAESHGAVYIALPENRGYGAGVNAAVSALPSSVEWILISNPDIELGAGSLDRLIAIGRSDDRIGSVGPRILTPDRLVYPSAREIPSLRTGIGHALLATVWPSNPWTRRYRSEQADPETPRDAGWLSGACLLVRRDAFRALGGFDVDYFMYFEDVDLGRRLGSSGYRNVYSPDATVIHAGGHSTAGGTSVGMIAEHHRSARRFVRSKYRGVLLAPVRAALITGLTARQTLLSLRWRRAFSAQGPTKSTKG